jgi:hypothetical protein
MTRTAKRIVLLLVLAALAVIAYSTLVYVENLLYL